MLESAGKRIHIGGNIGTPILDLIGQIKRDDWLVWELANFQLKPASYSPHIAVCLMITPEHLDWHPSFEDYIDAKSNLFRHQKETDIAIYFADNEYSQKIANCSPGYKVPYFRDPGAYVRNDGKIVINNIEIINKSEVKLLGEHNLQNVCAAITAVWRVTQDQVAIKKVLSSFSGLEHRLEMVRDFEGVKYYDDSFATTPDTAIVAMQAVPEPKILILGGHDKGADYEALADEVTDSNVKHVIAIGLVGPRIAERLKSRGFSEVTEGLTDMKSIVQTAKQHAQPGDAVLLSTGTSSFGLFKDYKDRGNQFKQAVLVLS
jgi:UDP-N-acetylmuramoylalanine--D-glutamate ligase